MTSSAQSFGSGALTTSYLYDVLDGLKKVTDPGSLETTYKNGDLGWRLQTVSPDTGTTQYTYDPAGNLLTTVDANGVTVTRAYDELNRPTTVTFGSDTSLKITNVYDSGTLGIGRRTGQTIGSPTPSISSTFGYDLRGLLTSETRTLGGVTYTTGYSYDKSGNLTELRFPSNDPIARQGKANYEYTAERVSLVKAQVGASTPTIADGFQYKPFGPRTQMTFGNTLVDARSYDTRYRLGTWTLGSTVLNYTHTFDPDDNLTARTDNRISDHSYDRTYSYDSIHRLTSATGPWVEASTCSGGATYVYDANGNRTCKGESGTSTSYSYVSGKNRLASSSGGDSATYGYDNNGNTTSDGTHTYHFSAANRLDSVDPGSTPTAAYVYDGDGRRVVKTTSSATTQYFYDPSGQLIQEYVPATGLGTDYVYLDSAPVARVDWSVTETSLGTVLDVSKSGSNAHLDWTAFTSGGSDNYLVERKQVVDVNDKSFTGAAAVASVSDPTKTYDDPVIGNGKRYDYRVFKYTRSDTLFYYHTDHLGTPIAMTDGNGTPVWRAEYRPFGDLFSSSTGDNLRFPGQYFDFETGLHQNWLRDYAPKTGRYFESDPIGLEGGTNPYSYVNNQPTGQIDPAGLESWSDGLWRRLIELLSPEPTPDPVREREQRELADAAGVNPATGETRIAGLDGGAAARRGAKEGVATVGSQCTEQLAVQYGMPALLGVAAKGVGAMRRAVFDDAVSVLRHPPGVVRAGVAAGPINGQAALDVSLTVSANSTRRIGIDYAQGQFVVFDEHAAGMFHGHIRSWGDLTQAMQSVLRRAGMVDAHGSIILGN
jgi:RHS repeat-associated protein